MSWQPINQLPGAEAAIGVAVMNGNNTPGYARMNLTATTDPNSTNDVTQGYAPFSVWINTIGGYSVFMCVSAFANSAVWTRLDNVNTSQIQSLSETVVVTNSWTPGTVLRRTTSGYVKAQANNAANAYGAVGVVQSANASQYTIVYAGVLNWPGHGFAVGQPLYLSAGTPGVLTATAPSSPYVTIPMGVAIDSARLLIAIDTASQQMPGWGPESGAANIYSVSINPGPAFYYTGLQFAFIPTYTNTGASTLNVNGIGASPLLRNQSNPVLAGDMVAGKAAQVFFDGTNFQLLNPATSDTISNDSFIGSVAYFCMASAPTGWLLANGAAVSRTTYAKLFAALGTTYGGGDGTTTFNIPDLRGKFLRVLSNGSGYDPGRALGSLQNYATAAPVTVPGRGFSIQNQYAGGGNHTQGGVGSPFFDDSAGEPNLEQVAGGDAETRPVNVALGAFIRY